MYKLVIIDDEENILEGMTNLFPWEEIGFCVVGNFSNSKAALNYIDNNPVDVVLTDIEMPEVSGIDICRHFAENNSVQVVLFSSYQNYEYFRSAIQYAAVDYLLKPVKYSELLACFEKVKQKLNEKNNEHIEDNSRYYEKIVEKTRKYLQEHYQNASLEEASNEVNLSPSYLSKIFKEKSGKSFSDMLGQIRMEQAKRMLDDPKYKSYDIAFFLGYDNPKNFSRAFKTYYHISPSEYRQGISIGEDLK